MTEKIKFEFPLLSTLCDPVKSGVTKYEGEKYYIETGDVVDNEITSTRKFSFTKRPKRANLETQVNDVIFAKMKNTVKVLHITKNETECIFSTGFAAMRPKNGKILSRYLMHYFKSPTFQKWKDKFSFGETQKAINKEEFEKLKIPLPQEKTQGKIIRILDSIDRIQKNQKMLFKFTYDLIHSQFHQIYGDPKDNPNDWDYSTMDEILQTMYRYPTFYGIEYQQSGIPLIKIGNILKNGKLSEELTNYDFITDEINEKFPKTILDYEDLLMAVRGDGSTGKLGYVSSKKFKGSNISPNLLRLSPNRELCNPLFLFYLLRSPFGQALIKQKITRTAKKTITADEIKKITFPLPTIEIQNKFGDFVNKLESIRKKQISSETDSLFFQKYLKNKFFTEPFREVYSKT